MGAKLLVLHLVEVESERFGGCGLLPTPTAAAQGHHQHRSDMGCLAHDSGISRCRTSAEVGASSEGAHAQEEATRRGLMHLPAAGLEYPGDTATSVAPGVYEEMREQTRRPDARAMEQAHEHQ